MMDRRNLQLLTNQIADQMGFVEPVIVVNEAELDRLPFCEFIHEELLDVAYNRNAYGMAILEEERNVIFLFTEFMEKDGYTVEDLIDLIRHELMHLITQESDGEPLFEAMCKMSNIRL